MSKMSPNLLIPKGQAIAVLREKYGLSQSQLGIKVGKSQSTIVRIENGQQTPIDMMNKIATVLLVPLKEIVESLTPLGIENSKIFNAKKIIMSGLMTRQLPIGGRILSANKQQMDIREYVEEVWKNPELDALSLTPNEQDQLWQSLIDDKVFEYREFGYYPTMPTAEEFEHIIFLDFGNLINLTSMATRLPSTVRSELNYKLKTIRDNCSQCTAYQGEQIVDLSQNFVLTLCKSRRYILEVTEVLQSTNRLILTTILACVDLIKEKEDLEKYLSEVEDMIAKIVRMQTRIIDLIDDPDTTHSVCMKVMGEDEHPIMPWIPSVTPFLTPILT